MSRQETVKRVIGYGFSPQKALEIAIDIERGDPYTLAFMSIWNRTQREEMAKDDMEPLE